MGSRLSLAALTLLAGCGLPSGPEFPTEGVATAEGTHLISSTPQDRQSQAEMLDSQPPLPITHGALSRERSAELAGKLDQMLAVVLPEIDGLHADLDKAIAALPRPEHLATADPVLKTWRADDIAAYQDRITLYFDEAARRLTELRDATLTEAIAQARTLATPRGPMDTGATGDPALDTQLETFEEVLDGAVAMNALNVKKSGALVRRLDLFEAFSTFGVPQEAAMGGRILLFVGGDETGGVPRGVLAFRIDDERDPKRLHVVQALRHRILRGNTMVADLGWRLAPVPSGTGKLATETLDNLLIVPHFEPVIDQNAPAYDQLKDMRIQVDGQLAVFDGDKLLGGADWRVEFVVDLRGQLSWQVGQGKMMFDEKCEEVLGLGGK
ncbi:MAG TPA: hypothetical protein VFY71_18815 [Planctomycetota bacterium]|nr:hypothetical protein [Planctomycetota bacterium]